jgi:hypothetical protein
MNWGLVTVRPDAACVFPLEYPSQELRKVWGGWENVAKLENPFICRNKIKSQLESIMRSLSCYSQRRQQLSHRSKEHKRLSGPSATTSGPSSSKRLAVIAAMEQTADFVGRSGGTFQLMHLFVR